MIRDASMTWVTASPARAFRSSGRDDAPMNTVMSEAVVTGDTTTGTTNGTTAPGTAGGGGVTGFLRDAGVLLVGPVLWLVSTVVFVLVHGAHGWEHQALRNGLMYGVGVGGLVAAIGHTVFADQVAESIGWPTHSGFQFEVAMANLGLGVLGMWCEFTHSRSFWLATIVMTTVYLVGAAAGHVRDMVVEHNFSVNNAGFIFYWDWMMPAALIALYAATR